MTVICELIICEFELELAMKKIEPVPFAKGNPMLGFELVQL